jgi:hypothetical protein
MALAGDMYVMDHDEVSKHVKQERKAPGIVVATGCKAAAQPHGGVPAT